MFQNIQPTEKENKKSNSQPTEKKNSGSQLAEMLAGHEMVANMNMPVQKKELHKSLTAQKKASSGANRDSVSNGTSDSMPNHVQSKMENSFATSFADVKIHKNDNSATDMGASAYARGSDIHFAPGKYDPASLNGQELIGHELTHVVQQRQGRVQPNSNQQPNIQSKGLNVNDNPSLEKEADLMGSRAARNTSNQINGANIQFSLENSAGKTVQLSGPTTDQAAALQLVDDFINDSSSQQAFTNISKSSFASNLKDRIQNPGNIDQQSLNACGPASFFMNYASHDAVGFAVFALELYQNGIASLGSMIVQPDEDLLSRSPGDADWPAGKSVNDPVDWMLLTGLRNSEGRDNFDDPNDEASGITLPGEIEGWQEEVYSESEDDTNLVFTKSAKHLTDTVDDKFNDGYKCTLFINSAMLSGKSKKESKKGGEGILAAFPNHYVVYQGNLSHSDTNISFDVWTWGGISKVNMTKDDFGSVYYGAIYAK